MKLGVFQTNLTPLFHFFMITFLRCKIQFYVRKEVLEENDKRMRRPLPRIVFRNILGPNTDLRDGSRVTDY